MLILQFSYGNPIDKLENLNCCKLLPDLCWRHCLKTIKIENFRGSIEEEPLNKYFFENAEILENLHYMKGSALSYDLMRSRTVENVRTERL